MRMARMVPAALALSLALLSAGCDSESGDSGAAQGDKQLAAKPTASEPRGKKEDVARGPGDQQGVTPMGERVATIGLLNKRNNDEQDLKLRPGESREVGRVILRLEACERTAPYEFPQETGAFVQVDVLERGKQRHRRVFSGWLFKESPSRNVVEHPVYDVWVKDCAMRFPGEDPLPEDKETPAAKSGSPKPAAGAGASTTE
jgi:hypothetical protein